jgi:hypothetical protein
MNRSLLQCHRIFSKSLVIFLTLWIERHATIPIPGISPSRILNDLIDQMHFAPLEWTREFPQALNIIHLIGFTTLFSIAQKAETRTDRESRVRPFPQPSPPPLNTGSRLLRSIAILGITLLWLPSGLTVWNITFPVPPLFNWFFSFFLFWAGLLFLYYHPRRAEFSPGKWRAGYLFFSLMTPFLSLDRLVLSVVFSYFLPSIIQHLFSATDLRHAE